MTKTSGDFRAAASKALEALADALLPRLRPIMDELGAVSCVLCLFVVTAQCTCPAVCDFLPNASGRRGPPSTQPALSLPQTLTLLSPPTPAPPHRPASS